MTDIRKESLLLPNLRYKENDKKIYFKTNRCVRIVKNNKTVLENMFPVGDLALSGRFELFNIIFECNIQEIERDDGLAVKIKYNNNNKLIYEKQLLKIAKYIEGLLCNLDTNYIDDFIKENDFYEKFNAHDSDSENSRNYLNNNSNNVDTNSDSYSNENQEYDEEYDYDDYDYDDPVF